MATSAALIALALFQTVGAGDTSPAPSAPRCHGPSIEQMATKLVGAQHFEFTQHMLEPFLGLWAAAQQPQIAETPDCSATIAVSGGRQL